MRRLERVDDCDRLENNFAEFLKDGWHAIDSAPYQQSWAIEAVCDHLEAVTLGSIKRLLINVPPRCAKTNSASIAWNAWIWARARSSYISGPQVKFLSGSYNAQLSLLAANKTRRMLLSPWYQARWADRFSLRLDQNTKTQFDNTAGGSRIATSVRGSLLGLGGDVLVVDDPHNVETEKKIESDADRRLVASWWQELSSTRLNDPKQSVIVVVMQRLHQTDLSGLILRAMEDGEEEFIHLCLPMEFEDRRKYWTVILPQYAPTEVGEDPAVWADPRAEEAKETKQFGQLMWPERFGPLELERMKNRLGPYMCTPAESPVLMADLSLKPISEVKIGDRIAGFDVETGREANAKADYKRRKLRPSSVVGKTSFVSQVVKITLDTGEVIRCTPEHRWYMGKEGGRRGHMPDGTDDIRPLYRPAVIGRKLMRVCPSSLPKLTYEEQRMAGWLSGFFDGEGSAGANRGCDRGRVATQITFYQGTGRNRPLCDLLEEHLGYFDFPFTFSEHVRDDRRVNKSATHKSRVYRLYRPNGALQLIQRFLHIVQPHKWRERLLTAAYGANWISGQEKVVSIEPDGEEMVYALETETGNYVVWGLASSNSAGRLQQSPVPKGGGIIKEDWWFVWNQRVAQRYHLEWNAQRKEFPRTDLVVASLDTAMSEKDENNYSALTVWGLWKDLNRNTRAMLMFGWQKRIPLNGKVLTALTGETEVAFKARQEREWGLVEWVADTCKRYKVQRLLIENKTRGHDVANEIRRLYARENWGLLMIEPAGDKVSRTHSIVPLFTNGAVWAPVTKWSEEIISNVSIFPKGEYDDLHDSVTQFLNWARASGILQLSEESSAALEDEQRYQEPERNTAIARMYGVG